MVCRDRLVGRCQCILGLRSSCSPLDLKPEALSLCGHQTFQGAWLIRELRVLSTPKLGSRRRTGAEGTKCTVKNSCPRPRKAAGLLLLLLLLHFPTVFSSECHDDTCCCCCCCHRFRHACCHPRSYRTGTSSTINHNNMIAGGRIISRSCFERVWVLGICTA